MKCTNNIRRCLLSIVLLVTLVLMTGCGKADYSLPYDTYSTNSSYTIKSMGSARKAETFAADLCVVSQNYNESAVDMSEADAAALFSIDEKEILYSKNAHEVMHPASLTKVMTALLAMKHGNRDDVLTASSNVIITESGAQLCGLKPGDTMTLDQALRILLLYSANDVAIMIAEQYGSTVDNFCNMMTEEAHALGATNCNFVNPNGLTEDEQYVTPYDMYLIFKEACKYELFKEIISMSGYTTTYYDKNGDAITFDKSNTNRFVNGDMQAPEGITVIGGKTGTTAAAGHCLILLSSDTSGKSYISIIMKSSDGTILYTEMNDLLEIINK